MRRMAPNWLFRQKNKSQTQRALGSGERREAIAAVASACSAPQRTLMSSKPATKGRERIARRALGVHTVTQLGRPLASVVVHPEQLSGPRARTCIRPGAATTRRPVMSERVAVGIDISKEEIVVAVAPSGEQWPCATTPEALERTMARIARSQPAVVVMEAT